MTQHQVVPAEDLEMIHEEHVELHANLRDLDEALRHLGDDSKSNAHSCDAPGLASMVRRFQVFLPLHFQHEEKGMLDRVSEVSPELMELTTELKQEHRFLTILFDTFAKAVSDMKEVDESPAEYARIKLLGVAFTDQMTRHIGTEETELAGFL
jgi:hemerythrin-like domain-containing protein